MKDLSDKSILEYWFHDEQNFIVQYDPDQVEIHIVNNQVIFSIKTS